jgi:hypothetical protein
MSRTRLCSHSIRGRNTPRRHDRVQRPRADGFARSSISPCRHRASISARPGWRHHGINVGRTPPVHTGQPPDTGSESSMQEPSVCDRSRDARNHSCARDGASDLGGVDRGPALHRHLCDVALAHVVTKRRECRTQNRSGFAPGRVPLVPCSGPHCLRRVLDQLLTRGSFGSSRVALDCQDPHGVFAQQLVDHVSADATTA